MANIAVHTEVPKEVVAVEIIGALVDQYGDRYLAGGCCRQPKKWTLGDSGSRKKQPLPTDRWGIVPFLHCIRAAVIKGQQSRRDDARARNAKMRLFQCPRIPQPETCYS
jgi:hypothetical protein